MNRTEFTLPLMLSLLMASAPLSAAEPVDTDGVDAVLQGFDQPAAQSSDAVDSVLDGFDDSSGAGGGDEVDQVMDGFDEPIETGVASTPVAHNSRWQLSGSTILSTAYNYAHDAPASGQTDYRGLSRLRAKLNLELDGDLSKNWQAHIAGYVLHDFAYQINGREQYSDEVLDENESEYELGEAFVQGELNSSLDLKLGRQIVVWGKSDNLRVTDVLNPMDNREPGMVDIEDLRLPLTMAKLDYYVGDWGFSALAIPEIRFNKNPVYGSEFYPFPTPMPDEDIPSDGGDNTEYALAANGVFSGWDLSLYWAQLYDDNPHTVSTPSGPELQHSRLTMSGLAANAVIGSWLLKGEGAHFSGLEYSTLPGKTKARTDSLLGIEYNGFRDTTLSLEIANRHLHDYEVVLSNEGVEENEWQSAVRYTGDFLHARLHLLALYTAFGDDAKGGGFGRLSAAYDLQDALTVTGGLVAYQEGDKIPFNAIGDNDRIFIDVKYSF
ncbi:MAG: DUF1302 family protein [Pseudomonadota bacterium]